MSTSREKLIQCAPNHSKAFQTTPATIANILTYSERYEFIWKAPQQNTYAVQTLRSVETIPGELGGGERRDKLRAENQQTDLLAGRRSLHIQKHTCSSCGYPAAKIRQCTFLSASIFWGVNCTRLEGYKANAKLQTTGARRLSGERPLVLDVWDTWRAFPESSRMASRPVPPRTRGDHRPRPNKGCICGVHLGLRIDCLWDVMRAASH